MQNKFTLTITDINGSKHYNLHMIVKKIILYSLVAAVFLIIGGASLIYVLSDNLQKIESKKNKLVLEQLELNIKKEKLQNKVDEKEREFKELEDKVVFIEKLVGIIPDENIKMDERLENISISSAEQKMIFEVIPNGNVLPTLSITGRFGWRQHPILNKKEFHPGIDLRGNRGTPVKAPANGVVEFAAFHKHGFGNLIILDHSFGFQTRYAHLDKILVKTGQFVKKGEILGEVGSTGLSTGPHLHYEVRFIGKILDPINFLTWTNSNFENIFEKERIISWRSLVNIVTNSMTTAKPQQKPQS